MNTQRMHMAGLAGLLAIGAVTITMATTQFTGGSTEQPQDTWTIERALPSQVATEDSAWTDPSFYSRYKRQPCVDREPTPSPSSIARDSGLFLLSHPDSETRAEVTPTIIDQMI